jgi:hypothetical protein
VSKLTLALALLVPLALFGLGCSKPKPKQFPTTSNLKYPPGIDNCIQLSGGGSMTFENSHIETQPVAIDGPLVVAPGIKELAAYAKKHGLRYEVVTDNSGYYCASLMYGDSGFPAFIARCTKDGPEQAAREELEYAESKRVISGNKK